MLGPRPRVADSRLSLLFLWTLGLGLLAGASRADDLPSQGEQLWGQVVQPQLAARCGACHVGTRFAFASLVRSGPDFTPQETSENYERFLDLISLDAPEKSRLLAKGLGDGDADGLTHAAGRVLTESDPFYQTLLGWIRLERSERCADCGTEAPVQYLAYVLAPRMFWAFERDPIRDDHGLRDRARIMLQPLQPGTLTPVGKPIDFLGDGFCGADGHCDFGNLAANNAGTALVFECRLDPDGGDWVNDVRWNVCIAEIGPDGRAVNPRFLVPPERRHRGETVARSDPFGLLDGGGDPLKGHYDLHFRVRRRQDATPIFGPDDQSVYFSSRGPDPRSGIDATQTYHGTEHLNNIVTVDLDGEKLATVYSNEGGVADLPFFLRNGRIAFHTWNLERMDRHMYVQSTPSGMMELPVLLGRVQGPNMWGKATELASGAILGMTGRRRSSIDNYVPFLGDHTLGTGLDPTLEPVKILDTKIFEEILDFPDGYCNNPPDGQNCVIDAFYADPSYAPDGRAFIAYNPDRTYVLQGEELYLAYAHGDFNNLYPYTPTRLGISLIDRRGQLTRVLDPPEGTMLRYPAWVGRRQPPRDARVVVNPIEDEPQAEEDQPEDEDLEQEIVRARADVHIADVPLWLSFGDGPDDEGGTSKARLMSDLDRIVSLRVLSKEMAGNACLNDGLPYRYAVNANFQDHPSAFGINNATGYRRLDVPAEMGGDAYGDVPLEADRSVRLRVPAGELLLFQGVDANGHVVRQHARVFAMPSQQAVDTSVKRDQYASQCSSCHGTITPGDVYKPLSQIDQIPLVPLSFDTLSVGGLVDLTDAVPRRSMTYRETLRPLLDATCVSCHSGPMPAGQLSLEASYSKTANFPAGKWATQPGLALPEYMNSVPEGKRVPGYSYSVNYSWLFKDDESDYRENPAYAPLIAGYAPLAALAPWDPGFQNLYANDGQRLIYLSGFYDSNFGRGDRLGGNSSDSWLIEILTGLDLDPTRGPLKQDHTHYLTPNEIRDFMAVIDLGFPYTSRCDDRTVPEGPNAGLPWGDPEVRQR